jgi:hypothetical protein
MKKVMISILAASTVGAAALPAAAAPGWVPVSQRAARVEMRIDEGVRSGGLTRGEARDLRAQLNDLQRLEVRYLRNGLNLAERRDLNVRYDRLVDRVFRERDDRQHRAYRDRSDRRW